MTLDQLTAFAVVDDHARQEQVRNTHHVWESTGQGIRRALLAEHVPVTDKLARFVTLEAYEEAGGTVTRDLFSDEDQGGVWFADPELLQRLAAEKMTVEADAVQAEGWGWVEAFESFPYSGFYSFGRVYPRALPLADESRDELACLTERRDTLLTPLETAPTDDEAMVDLGTIEAAIGAVREREVGLCSRRHGQGGLRDRADPRGPGAGGAWPYQARGRAAREEGAARGRDRGDAGRGGRDGTENLSPALPDALVEDLTAQRTAALRVEVMRRPDLALAGTVHALALPVFYRHAWTADSAFDLKGTSIGLSERIRDVEACPAGDVQGGHAERVGVSGGGTAGHHPAGGEPRDRGTREDARLQSL